MGKKWQQWQILFSWAPKSLWIVTAAMKLKDAAPWKKSYDQPIQHIEKQRHHFANKVGIIKAMVCSVVMYGCESWAIKKTESRRTDSFQIMFLEKTLKSPLDCKEIQPVDPKGDQS